MAVQPIQTKTILSHFDRVFHCSSFFIKSDNFLRGESNDHVLYNKRILKKQFVCGAKGLNNHLSWLGP